jgi:hypothetical protein
MRPISGIVYRMNDFSGKACAKEKTAPLSRRRPGLLVEAGA